MAPITHASDDSNHQALLDQLDIYAIPKPFRRNTWRPAQRRNKNIRQIVSEASRREASTLPTNSNSGTATPFAEGHAVLHTGVATQPATDMVHLNITKAAQTLSTFVDRPVTNGAFTGPTVTYTNIESAPSLHPSSQRHYCDITGLPAPYTDPKTRLRYHNGEVFTIVRALGQGATENYLAARGAHVVLK